MHSILSIHSSLFFSENVSDPVKFCIVEIVFKANSRIFSISMREEDTVSMLIVTVLFVYILRVFLYILRVFVYILRVFVYLRRAFKANNWDV